MEKNNTPVKVSADEIEDTVIEHVRNIVDTPEDKVLSLHSFTQQKDEEDLTLLIAVGEEKEDGTVLLCTFGLGAEPTNGSATFEGEEYNFHSELFTVASSVENVKMMTERLAELGFAYLMSKNSFVPGSIISSPAQTGWVFTEKTLNDNGVSCPPIICEDFLLAFVAATPLLPGEPELLTQPDTFDDFHKYLISLKSEAYSPERSPYIQ